MHSTVIMVESMSLTSRRLRRSAGRHDGDVAGAVAQRRLGARADRTRGRRSSTGSSQASSSAQPARRRRRAPARRAATGAPLERRALRVGDQADDVGHGADCPRSARGHASGRSMTGLIVIGRPDGERQVGAGAAAGRGERRRDHQRRQHAAVPRSAHPDRAPDARRTRRARRTGCTASWMPPSRHRSGAGCSWRARRSARRCAAAAAGDRGRRHRALSACPAARPRAGPRHSGRGPRAPPARGSPRSARRRFMPSSPSCDPGDGRAAAADRSPAAAARLRGRRRHRPLARGLAGDAARCASSCRRAAAASRWCRRAPALYQRIERAPARHDRARRARRARRRCAERSLPADLPLMRAVAVPELLAHLAGRRRPRHGARAGDRPDPPLRQAAAHLAAPPAARAARRRRHSATTAIRGGRWRCGRPLLTEPRLRRTSFRSA